jgi:sirohydrochlorin ferrochelatase
MLAAYLGVEVGAAYVAAGEPRLAELKPAVVASYLLAPGVFHDAAASCGAGVVSAPLGDHPAVADVVVARYDDTAASVS